MMEPRAGRGIFGGSVSRCALAILLLGAVAASAAAPAVPVRVGGDGERPACDARAVINDREVVDGRVDIASGPSRGFSPIDRLEPGSEVFLCDENSTFRGIIYGEGDCGLAEPIERRASYRGACDSGWVHNRSIEPSAAGPV